MKKVRNSSNGLSSARYLSPKRRLCRDRNSSPRHADGTGFSVVGEKPKSGRNRVEFLKKTTSDPLKQPFVSKNVKTLDSSGAIIEHDGLSRPSTGTRKRQQDSKEDAALRLERMRGAVRTLLDCIGEDASREGLSDTPSRFAKALLFLTKGYQTNVHETVNNALFHERHSGMVIVKDIEIFSLCEHHLTPFTGKMHIGYVPSGTVIGLSKLPRIAEVFSRRLQIQERLTKEVALAIDDILKPQGVAVVMESSHLCMVMRGIEKTGTSTLTSCMLGCFMEKNETRKEFLDLVGLSR